MAEAVSKLLTEYDPTIRKPALKLASKLAGYVASSIAVQTQAVQRALPAIEEIVEPLTEKFLGELVRTAEGQFNPRFERFNPAPPPAPASGPVSLASDWAGPVAGPTVIERHFGIPRSTLFRWQKRGEAIALRTGSSRFVFPLMQFVDGRPAEGIATLIVLFGGHRSAWQWLMAPSAGGETRPIDVLLSGRAPDVVAAATQAVKKDGGH
ncbi:MAG: hypothetical protein EOS41_31085 [Mesorhizobium sp.]|uniref:antitoxin Xre/MbcA/ParS-like domain-containing protein n=1 Tax=Mesorhizobium sp. TaxID=1871066 RepID=UPI000FE86A15|nr:hypothetical protein [Mesorhizobium sp.]RWE18952.1 MAG: hypothetical protein EOS41_31085 [Mesorhizobium sp.]